MVGNVALGSDHPIKIQTMTTSDTKDVAKTVEEVHEFLNTFLFLQWSLIFQAVALLIMKKNNKIIKTQLD